MTVQNGTQRLHRLSDGHATYVPLWTATPEGDWQIGELPIPIWLLEGGEHSNRSLKLQAYLTEKLGKWLEWKLANGWIATSEPLFNIGDMRMQSTAHGQESDPELRFVDVQCRFKRAYPLYMGLSDFLQVKDDAERYGVDLSKPKQAGNRLPKPKKHIDLGQVPRG